MENSEAELPDFITINCSVEVKRSVRDTWKQIKSFKDAGTFLKIDSKMLRGSDDLGSTRIVGDNIIEVLIGRTKHSYTYIQIQGPMAEYHYSGHLSLEPIDDLSCQIKYQLCFDKSKMSSEKSDSETQRIKTRFQGAIEMMKKTIEEIN